MNKQNSIGDRLKEWITAKDMSAIDFSKRIHIQRSALSHIFSGRNKPSVDVLLKIKNTFPEISLDWLITGENIEIHAKESTDLAEGSEDFVKSNVTNVTLFDIPTHNQSIKDNFKKEPEKYSKARTLIRVIELYSDGTFRHFDS